MEKNFDVIFSQLQKFVESQVQQNGDAEDVFAQVVNGGGSIPFEVNLDENGNAHYEIQQKGWGVTISATAKIEEPGGAVFNIAVSSSDGGGGSWYNIPTGGSVSCKLETSFWHKTTIKVDVHSSKPNCKLKAKLDYNY